MRNGTQIFVDGVEISISSGSTAGNPERQQDMLADGEARLFVLDLHQGCITWTGARDHHMVDGSRQMEEEFHERSRIVGVECCTSQRAEFTRGSLQALGVPCGEDNVGALDARPPRRLETNAGASANHDDGLSEEFRFALDSSSRGSDVH